MPVGQHAFDIELQGGAPRLDGAPATTSQIDRSPHAQRRRHRPLFLRRRPGRCDRRPEQDQRFGRAVAVDEPLRRRCDQRRPPGVLLQGQGQGQIPGHRAGRHRRSASSSNCSTASSDADPQDIFRRLDPDLYYPVYGDDSTTYRDVDTRAACTCAWTGTRTRRCGATSTPASPAPSTASTSRSLYGARVQLALAARPTPGAIRAPKCARSVPKRRPRRATANSSAPAAACTTSSTPTCCRVRTSWCWKSATCTTGRVENRVRLLRGADYEIDELQGRLLLTRPLSQITRENMPTLTRDTPLDGFEQRLLVDYEYVPSGFDPDDVTAGLRGKHWFGDHVGVGATYVDENRAGEDYTLARRRHHAAGGPRHLPEGRIHARPNRPARRCSSPTTAASPSPSSTPVGRARRRGQVGRGARQLEGTGLDRAATGRAGAWWREVGAGYLGRALRQGLGHRRSTAPKCWASSRPTSSLYARYSKAERGQESLTQAQLTAEWRISDHSTLSGEIRRVEEEQSAAARSPARWRAVSYTHRFGTHVGAVRHRAGHGGRRRRPVRRQRCLHPGRQVFVRRPVDGRRRSHHRRSRRCGARSMPNTASAPEHTVYGGYTYSTDTTAYDPLFNPNRPERLDAGPALAPVEPGQPVQRKPVPESPGRIRPGAHLRHGFLSGAGLEPRLHAADRRTDNGARAWSTVARSASAAAAPRPIRSGRASWNGAATPAPNSASSGSRTNRLTAQVQRELAHRRARQLFGHRRSS